MKTKIFSVILLLAVGFCLSNGINSVNAENQSKNEIVANEKIVPVNNVEPISVKPLDLVASPNAYLNKRIKIVANFDKFSILGLDYPSAMRSSEKYITFLIQRPNVSNDIPLSELKNFLSRGIAEKFIDLNNGDIIEYTGTVFSSALGDAWVDVDNLKVIKKKEIKK